MLKEITYHLIWLVVSCMNMIVVF